MSVAVPLPLGTNPAPPSANPATFCLQLQLHLQRDSRSIRHTHTPSPAPPPSSICPTPHSSQPQSPQPNSKCPTTPCCAISRWCAVTAARVCDASLGELSAARPTHHELAAGGPCGRIQRHLAAPQSRRRPRTRHVASRETNTGGAHACQGSCAAAAIAAEPGVSLWHMPHGGLRTSSCSQLQLNPSWVTPTPPCSPRTCARTHGAVRALPSGPYTPMHTWPSTQQPPPSPQGWWGVAASPPRPRP